MHEQQPPAQRSLRAYKPVLNFSRAFLLTHFALVSLLLFWALTAQAQNLVSAPIEINHSFSERKIGRDISILEDKSGQLTFDQVRTPELATQFAASNKDSPSFGYTQSAYWAHFNLTQQHQSGSIATSPLFLTLAYAQTDLAQLWCTDASGTTVVQQRAGDHVPRSEWPTSYREPTFQLTPTATTCWLRAQTSASMVFPITLYSEKAFIQMHLTDNALQALYFGALLVMLVYNGLIAISTRSLAYSSYSLFLLSYGLFQCTFSGYGYALFWVDLSIFNDAITPFSASCVAFFSLIFASVLLDLRRTAPRWQKFYLFTLGLYSVTLVLPWVVTYSTAIQTVFAITPLWAIFLLGSGLYLSYRGVRVAKIYLAAWLVFISGTLIIMASRLGWLPVNAFTSNSTQIGSAIEFILLSFALADRIKTTQAALLGAQKKIAEGLRLSEQELTHKVEQRTAELQNANQEILQAYQTAQNEREQAELARKDAETAQQHAEHAREVAETAREQTAQTLETLQATQAQLIQAEKMASLGLLVSNVAHEINTPIGAVQSSVQTVADSMDATLENMPRLLDTLSREHRDLFLQLIEHAKGPGAFSLSTREERTVTKKVTAELEALGVEGAPRKARLLVKLGAYNHASTYLPLLSSPDTDFILSVATGVADVLSGTSNINTAAAKIARIVASLKQLSGNDRASAMFDTQVYRTIEAAIGSLEVKLHNVDVVRRYQDMSPLRCDPEALQQVWTHLISNALHASNHQGVIMVGLRTSDGQVEVKVTDFGCGMTPEVKDRAFEPFFTTRASGEGGGMGLSIAKNIVDAHKGSINVQTEVGAGTTVTVTLPYQT